ncbi:MAG: tetratricopeptide repeat protein [Elusimicrobia bacterium]|nr:tetratricopeptide repeat protein [Elusimicrobiota bacterium]
MFGLIAFSGIFRAGFLWDDHEMIEANPRVQSVSIDHLQHFFTHDVFDGKGDPYYRPLQSVLNMADYRVWGARPWGFHFTNLFLHIATACLLFVASRRAGVRFDTALTAGILFVVHPIGVEQLLIIAGRAELMAALFTLAAVIATQQGTRRSDLAGGLFCLLAAFSKESGVVAPLMAAAVVPRLRSRSGLLFAATALAGWAVYFPVRALAVSGDIPLAMNQIVPFFVQELPSVLVEYGRILLVPVDLHSHRRMVFSSTQMTLAGLAVLALIIFLLVKAWPVLISFNRRGPEVSLNESVSPLLKAWPLAAWAGLSLGTKVPLLATNALMLDHWAYVPAMALCVGVSVLFEGPSEAFEAGGKKARLKWVPVFLGLFWMGMSQWNTAVRNTDEKMYLWALRHPTSSVVRYNLALLYHERGDDAKALPLLKTSRAMNPGRPQTDLLLASVMFKLGQYEEALAVLAPWTEGRASARPPILSTMFRTQADIQYAKSDRTGARRSLEQYLLLEPDDTQAQANLNLLR